MESTDFQQFSSASEARFLEHLLTDPSCEMIRIVLDNPRTLRQIRLEFSETVIERTQEFTLRWSNEATGPFSEIVRQQWNFSPQGSTSEVEDYQVQLKNLSVLELTLKPDLTPDNAFVI